MISKPHVPKNTAAVIVDAIFETHSLKVKKNMQKHALFRWERKLTKARP